MQADSNTRALVARLEFIFSDSNLQKDAYTRALLDGEDGWAPLVALLSYRRIAALTSDVAVLARSARECQSLIVSADGAGVRRAIPFTPRPAGYYDARTVYVERLPLHSHPDGLADYFTATCGPVTHVSMPRFRGTRR